MKWNDKHSERPEWAESLNMMAAVRFVTKM